MMKRVNNTNNNNNNNSNKKKAHKAGSNIISNIFTREKEVIKPKLPRAERNNTASNYS